MGIYNPPPAGNGSGDMTKSVYDTNDDGKVNSAATADSADAVTWSNVSGKPSVFTPDTHAHAQSDVTNLVTDLSGKQATLVSATNIKTINGSSILGSGDLYPSHSYSSAFATATTSISAATYADITGCSVSLVAGTWLILAHVVGGAANAIVQCFGAITHSDNTVIAESAISRPASGTASLNSPISMTWQAIVTPASTTTYKLRAARGLTTHTGTWTVYDGTGYNTTNHATNNTDKGTSIIAIRLA